MNSLIRVSNFLTLCVCNILHIITFLHAINCIVIYFPQEWMDKRHVTFNSLMLKFITDAE
jgi:hypothetical protein